MADLLPEQQPPTPAPATHSDIADDNTMDAKVTCYPPLGQVTLIARQSDSVRFTLLLETPLSSSGAEDDDDDLEVSLWHNHNGHHEWSELPLKLTSDYETVLLINQAHDSITTKKSYFTTTLSGLPKHGHVVRFTLKFRRPSTSSDWSWANEKFGIEDGELHYQTNDYQKHSSHSLQHFFPDISSEIRVTEEKAETDETYLYSLTAPAKGSEGRESGYQHHLLGVPAYVY